MTRRYLNLAAWMAVLAFTGCAATNTPSKETIMKKHDEDIKAIKQLAEDWRAGWLTGNAELLLSLYADDPVLMPQDHPPVIGKKAIRPLYESVLNEFKIESQGKLMEVEASGDWGYFWSTYSLTATPKTGGQPVKSAGKSVFIVKRQPGGDWKIVRLMDNSDGAPNGP